MIRPEKYTQALMALQQVIIRARFLMSKEAEAGKVLSLLDAAEELPAMIADVEDRTEEFVASLQTISERYPYCRNIFVEFSGKVDKAAKGLAEQLQAA